jgi:hypothetical protein
MLYTDKGEDALFLASGTCIYSYAGLSSQTPWARPGDYGRLGRNIYDPEWRSISYVLCPIDWQK